MARSVLSRACSPETVDRRMDSGVSLASRSPTLARSADVSAAEETSSAFAWASETFDSASSMKRLKTSYTCVSGSIDRAVTVSECTSIVATLVFCEVFL